MNTRAATSPSPESRTGAARLPALGLAAAVFGTVLLLRSAETPPKPAANPVGVPVGTLLAYAGSGPQALEGQGWLICDGRELNAQEFPELHAALGSAWGARPGSGTFRLPDLRGRFLRGANRDASGPQHDPDRDTRLASAPGGNTGNDVGSLQEEGVGPHTHPLVGAGDAVGAGGEGGWVRLFGTRLPDESAPLVRSEGTVQAGAGAETRPVNVYVNWIIRAR